MNKQLSPRFPHKVIKLSPEHLDVMKLIGYVFSEKDADYYFIPYVLKHKNGTDFVELDELADLPDNIRIEITEYFRLHTSTSPAKTP